jgi:EF hand
MGVLSTLGETPMSMQRQHLAALLGCTALAFGLPAFGQTAAPAADAAAAFKRADANGDGKLSKAEATSLPAIASRFDELDADKDTFLSMAEFSAGLAAPK